MKKSMFVLIAFSSFAAACHYAPAAVPLRGPARDIAALAGKWDGWYSGTESGRTGSILFTIEAGSDTAHGDVVMTPKDGMAMRAADAGTRMHEMHAQTAEMLRVSFVRIEGGTLRGELEPYIAPDCHCQVSTVFRGAVSGDRIEGTFVTRGPQNLVQEGKWSAERQKP